jgi:hypothetical protein
MKKAFLSAIQLFSLLAVTALSVEARQVVSNFDVHYWSTNIVSSNGPAALYLANIRGKQTWRDLVVANKESNSVSVRLCKDTGEFNANATSYPVGLAPVAVIGTDLNHDNFDDVVTANFGTNTISVLRNQKNNTLAAATNYTVGTIDNSGPVALATGILTTSGRQDIVVANLNDNTITVLTNAGNCVLLVKTNIAVGIGPNAIALVDFNNDNTLDIVTANTNGTLTILQGTGAENFTFYTNLTLFANGDPQPSAIGAADFNGDGRMDLVTANYNSNSVTVLTNTFSTNFDISTNIGVGTNPRGLLVRDINRDGKIDLVSANETSGDIHVLLANANGSFASSLVVPVGNGPVAVAGSNFNEDGLNDLAVACYGDNIISILLYDLPLTFSDTSSGFEDSAKSITVSAQQVGNTTFTYTIIANPAHGSLTGSGPTYTYTPETNYFGVDRFTYKVSDGVNDSATGTNVITLLSINDAPSFVLSTNLIRSQKFAMQTYPNFIASKSTGPTNEAGQTVTYITGPLSVSNIFVTRPSVQPNGTLTFKPSTTNFGTSTVSLIIQDSGGRSYGGSNQSAPQIVTIENPGPNPFIALKGTYNGLFSNPSSITPESAGSFSFTLSNVGAYSGGLTIGTRRYSFSGQFDMSGAAQTTLTSGGTTYTVTLQLDLTNGTDQVTGTVSTLDGSADLLGDRLTFDSILNPTALAGKYSLLIPGSTQSADYPNGDGYGMFTIASNGKVTFTGMLADNASVSQSSYVSKNGTIPFYATLYSGVGVLTGWITVTNQETNSLIGSLTWSTGSYYVPGWNTNVTISGSSYVPPAIGTRVINATNLLINLREGDLVSPIAKNATLSSTNTFTIATNIEKVVLGFNSAAGTVSGSFKHPVTLQTVLLKGMVFQQQGKVEGFFKGPTTTGHFEVTTP